VSPELFDEVARLSGLRRRDLVTFEAHELVRFDAADEVEELVRRCRRIDRLRRHLALDYDEIDVILRLVERVERLEGRHRVTAVELRVVEEIGDPDTAGSGV